MRVFKSDLKLNLALQGGGAHGAFTWGVLDRLLDEEAIEFGWISATSAGAVNAVALAAGLADGGRKAAQQKLREVWTAVYRAGVPDLLRLNPLLYSMSRSSAFSQMASLISPYEFNPMGFDPLRKLLNQTIDFAAIRERSSVELVIVATEVASGRPHVFRRAGLTVDSVLASACLPTLHHAVEIDGVAYWDGGFSANPDLLTIARESPVRDTLLVQINPIVKKELPTGAREIAGHMNRLTFNAPLRRDVQLIETLRTEASRSWGAGQFAKRLARHRFHIVEAGRHTASLSAESKLKVDWGLFTYLHGAGRTETHKWLDRHRADVGKRETADLGNRFLRSDGRVPEEEAVSGRRGAEAGPSRAPAERAAPAVFAGGRS